MEPLGTVMYGHVLHQGSWNLWIGIQYDLSPVCPLQRFHILNLKTL